MTPTESHATHVSSRRAVKDVAVQIGGQGINILLGIVTTVVIVRSLGSQRYGEWATILATAQLVALFGNLGLETVAVRFAAHDPEHEGSWVAAATGLQLVIAFPILIAFLIVIVLISGNNEMLVAGIVLSLLNLTAAISTLRVAFRLHVRNDAVIAFGLLNGFLWTGAVVAVAASGGGLIPFAIAFVVISIITQGGLAWLALKTMPIHWRGSRRLWPQLARVGISVGLGLTLTFAYARIDQLLLYELAPHPSEVGIYAAMYKILENASFIPLAMMTTLFPIMAGLHPHQPERLRRIIRIAIDYLVIVSVGALALTLVASRQIVELLFGASYASGSDVLTVLMAAYVPICLGNVAGNMIVATGQQRQYLWYAATGLVLNLALNVIFMPTYGMHAAAWITLATEVTVVSLSLRAVLRRIEMRLNLPRITAVALSAAVAAGLVWALAQTGARAVPLVLAMTVLYPLILFASGTVDREELHALISSRRDRETPI
jgi:O-antigen/teichoic acid export membrane protein